MPREWLEGVSRRTLKDISRRYTPEEVIQLITRKSWPYKVRVEFYEVRDLALMALLLVTGGRISEVLALTRDQFELDSDPNFVLIRNMKTLKVAQSGMLPYRDEVPLPRKGELSRLTDFIVKYLGYVGANERLFNFKRQRAWQIVNYVTGKWNHWFRSQAMRHYGRIFRDLIKLGDYMNIVNLETIRQYVRESWREDKEKLLV